MGEGAPGARGIGGEEAVAAEQAGGARADEPGVEAGVVEDVAAAELAHLVLVDPRQAERAVHGGVRLVVPRPLAAAVPAAAAPEHEHGNSARQRPASASTRRRRRQGREKAAKRTDTSRPPTSIASLDRLLLAPLAVRGLGQPSARGARGPHVPAAAAPERRLEWVRYPSKDKLKFNSRNHKLEELALNLKV